MIHPLLQLQICRSNRPSQLSPLCLKGQITARLPAVSVLTTRHSTPDGDSSAPAVAVWTPPAPSAASTFHPKSMGPSPPPGRIPSPVRRRTRSHWTGPRRENLSPAEQGPHLAVARHLHHLSCLDLLLGEKGGRHCADLLRKPCSFPIPPDLFCKDGPAVRSKKPRPAAPASRPRYRRTLRGDGVALRRPPLIILPQLQQLPSPPAGPRCAGGSPPLPGAPPAGPGRTTSFRSPVR